MPRRPSIDQVPPHHVAAPSAIALVFLLGTMGVASIAFADDSIPPAPATPSAPIVPAPTAEPVVPVEPAAPVAPVSNGAKAERSPSVGRTFETPEAAAKALLDAFEANDDVALRDLLGAGSDDLVQDGKDPIVQSGRTAIAVAAKSKLSLEKQADGHVLIVVGRPEYPLAIPLVAGDGGWRADAAAGRQELLARRVGEHELEAVGVCLAYADAQVAYASKDRNGDGVKEYAQRLVSTPNAKDGLYWDAADGDEASPAGPGLTPFREALKPDTTPAAPFNGYYWRVLTAQGANAPGGAYSYVINGRMIAGFALLAVPAGHRTTGVMSFLVSNQGKVYEKDLGADTLEVAAAIETFDPDASWAEVDEATLRAASSTSPEDSRFDDSSIPAGTVGGAATSSDAPASLPSSMLNPAPTPGPVPSPSTEPCPTK